MAQQIENEQIVTLWGSLSNDQIYKTLVVFIEFVWYVYIFEKILEPIKMVVEVTNK